MKKYVFLIFLSFVLMLSACTQGEEDKLNEYLNEETPYDISTEFNDGVVNIDIPMVNIEEEDVQYEIHILIIAVKSYPREKLNLFDEVNLHFFEKDTNKTVAEVQVKGNTLMETDWKNLRSFTDIPANVDSYDYKWEHK
ncbi:hypothetical protein V7138_01655 [Bacillus sp. JJ1533]|uniref:hypothetical protein n=1 Tax=Bacillus sp. JJ1533 TaxID=3122959 RepID=UPI002FFE8972